MTESSVFTDAIFILVADTTVVQIPTVRILFERQS